MKVSKVNHAKAAVRVSADGKGQEGVIYVDPSKKGKAVRDLSDRVRERSSKAQGLYNVFNAYDKKADDPYALKKIHDVVNGYFDRSSKARV